MRTSGPHYCTQCDQLFCADCKMSHLRSKISKSHIFWSGTNISTRCTDHAEDFIYLCADCDQLICRVCVTNAHTRHALVDIKDSNRKVSTNSLIVFPCTVMTFIVSSTSVAYVFVLPSINCAFERTFSTLESKYVDISVCTFLFESFISTRYILFNCRYF
jgi:hypothetical protein